MDRAGRDELNAVLLVACKDVVWHTVGAAKQAELAELLKPTLDRGGEHMLPGAYLLSDTLSFWSILGSYTPV